jgi:hypothetical protein
MPTSCHGPAHACTRWPLAALLLAISLLFGAPGSVATTHGNHQPGEEPVRLEVELQVLHIFDDQDWFGAGELHLGLVIQTCDLRVAVSPCWSSRDFQPRSVGGWGTSFSADSGDILNMDRLYPRTGDPVNGTTVSEAAGFPGYPGHQYRLRFMMYEEDPTAVELGQCFTFVMCDPDPALGSVTLEMNEANGWGLGVHGRVRSVRDDGDPGDFEVTYEVRRTPLPDLWARGIRQIGEGDRAFYCVVVQNVGERPSPQFPLSVRADGQLVRTLDPMPALDVGETTEHCAIRSELPAKEHLLSFVVDEGRRVAELYESNNRYDWGIPVR